MKIIHSQLPPGEAKRQEIILVDAANIADVTAIAFVTLAESGQIDGITAGEHIEVFEEWKEGVHYLKDQLRSCDAKLYRCVQEHTSQIDWPPDVATALWSLASDPAEEWPEWSQPVGAHDAYALGDKCSHNSKHWVSDCNANVWEPGVAMWTEAAE